MKALILAGGFGTRLRPLSCTRPKMMFPIANRPLLDWVLESLARYGVTRVILAVNYMADVLKRNFGVSKYGIKITYSYERKPLGTGGPIKQAERFLKSEEPFFMLNGDILSSIDYLKLFEAHKHYSAEATIALLEVDDPTRYGVVQLNENNQIFKFVEKPKIEEAPSKLINAGIYVLNKTIFDLIQGETKVSIEREIFPKLASRGSLYGHRFNSFWIDIGKPQDYINANKIMLNETVTNESNFRNVKISPKAKIIPPVVIGSGSVIGEDSCIGPYSSIGDNVLIGKGTKIQESIIFSKSYIDNFTSIRGAIIGEGAIIGDWVKIEDQCMIGDHAIISDNVTLTQKVQICPSKEVETSVLQPSAIIM